MTEKVDIHHHNLNPEEFRTVVDDWLEEQCKDYTNDLNARFEIKMYMNGTIMAVKQ